jgi:ABC-type sugar transport system permease subunit
VPVATRRPIWAGLALGILSTMTRAVWVAAFVVVGIEWLRQRDRPPGSDVSGTVAKKPAWILVLGLALLPFVFVSASNPIFSKLRGSLDLSSDTAQLRLGGVEEALQDMKGTAIFTGLGTNSFSQRHRNVLFADERGYLSVLPLVVLYDTGVIGALLVLGACAALSLGHAAPMDRRYARVFLLALLITGSATNPVWFGITWVLLAIVGVSSREADDKAALVPMSAA